MPPDLSLSIISADNLKLLLPCLRSVFENTHCVSLEVCVVDNASADGLAAVVRETFPQVDVICNATRLGFSTNNNLALQRSHGRYLMLLNDDTLVREGALDRLVEFMDAHPRAGAAGSYLFNPDGSFQAAFARFPSPFVEAIVPATNWSRPPHSHAPFEVDSVCGAAMIVRREASDQVGLLDTAFDPIYSEEVDWCYRIKHAGWKIYTLPESQVVHYGSVTMNRAVPRKYELLLSHKLLFFRKHAGRLAANVYRTLLALSTSFKLCVWALLSILCPGQPGNVDRRRLHWHVLKRIPYL